MITIFEGADATGKTTASQWLAQDQHAKLIHSNAPQGNQCAYHEYVQPIVDAIGSGYKNVVCDRLHVGELVYPQLVGRPGLFDVAGAWDEVSSSLAMLNARVIIVIRDGADIARTLYERGEDETIREVLQAQWLFIQYAAEYGWPIVDSKDLPPFSILTDDTVDVTHACPPAGEQRVPCCGRNVLELPLTERTTVDPSLVTCSGAGKP